MSQYLPIFPLARPYWKTPFRYDPEGQVITDAEGSRIIDVRGWGHLTGRAAHALDDAQASAIQDEIGTAVLGFLNSHWKA